MEDDSVRSLTMITTNTTKNGCQAARAEVQALVDHGVASCGEMSRQLVGVVNNAIR
jgi:hypothetical protein